MRTLLVLLSLLPHVSFATDAEDFATEIEQRWIDQRNSRPGLSDYPAGFGLSPETYDLAGPALTFAIDSAAVAAAREFGRTLFVALSLKKAGAARAAVNERRYLGRALARLNALAPTDEAGAAAHRAWLGPALDAQVVRAAELAGVELNATVDFLFFDLEFDRFGKRELDRATDRERAAWKRTSPAAAVWRGIEFGVPAALLGGAAYLANAIFLRHADGEFVLVWAMLTAGSWFAVKSVLPIGITGGRVKLPFGGPTRSKHDLVTKTLEECHDRLTAPKG